MAQETEGPQVIILVFGVPVKQTLTKVPKVTGGRACERLKFIPP
jgi:hypothetical protein